MENVYECLTITTQLSKPFMKTRAAAALKAAPGMRSPAANMFAGVAKIGEKSNSAALSPKMRDTLPLTYLHTHFIEDIPLLLPARDDHWKRTWVVSNVDNLNPISAENHKIGRRGNICSFNKWWLGESLCRKSSTRHCVEFTST